LAAGPLRLKLSFHPRKGRARPIAGQRETDRKEEKMIHNLKVLSLALVAVFAMSAMAASSALAVEETQGVLTSDGPVKLTGTDTVGKKRPYFNSTRPRVSNAMVIMTLAT
jgi:hypothetical protein